MITRTLRLSFEIKRNVTEDDDAKTRIVKHDGFYEQFILWWDKSTNGAKPSIEN